MYVLIIVLTVVVAILMIGIVLIQKSKGGGLSSQFGGGNQILGVRGTNNALEKMTWTLAGLILVLSVAAAYTMPKDDILGEEVRATKNMPAPAPTQQANAFATEAEETAAPAKEAAAPAKATEPATEATAPETAPAAPAE